MSENGDIVRLLWTGGWDSTFRLLQAVLLEHRAVQPYYLVSQGRESLDNEKRAMALIKDTLFSRYPESRDRVLPTIYFDIKDIGESAEISAGYNSMSARVYLGLQFEWLARLGLQEKIDKIELGIESGGPNEINRELKARFKPGTHELDEKHSDEDVFKVFGYFRFPLVDTTKLDMKKTAEDNGFLDILNMTWFCLHPIKGKACGRCNPCVGVVKSGLGSRLPLTARLRYYRRMVFDKSRDRLKRYPNVFAMIGKLHFLKKASRSVRR